MKNIIIMGALILGLNTATNAQTKKPVNEKHTKNELSDSEKAKKHTERAAVQLNLNESQKLEWETAVWNKLQANKPHRETLKGCTTPEQRKELHMKMRQNNKSFHESVNTILDKEQKQKYDVWKEEKMKKRHAVHKAKKERMRGQELKDNK